MSKVCQNCQCYCIYCQMCHTDRDIHDYNDTCEYFTPEHHIHEENEDDKEID